MFGRLLTFVLHRRSDNTNVLIGKYKYNNLDMDIGHLSGIILFVRQKFILLMYFIRETPGSRRLTGRQERERNL